ncbi:MAG: hypothetical protein ACI8WB_005131 [Phenylobacterium sp.]|jgi:hypothetical protein
MVKGLPLLSTNASKENMTSAKYSVLVCIRNFGVLLRYDSKNSD